MAEQKPTEKSNVIYMKETNLSQTIEKIQSVRNHIGIRGFTSQASELQDAIESLKEIRQEE